MFFILRFLNKIMILVIIIVFKKKIIQIKKLIPKIYILFTLRVKVILKVMILIPLVL